jgi:hypothetical protein
VSVVHLVLQRGEEAFGGSVVPAHPDAAEAGPQAPVGAEAGKLGRGVLGSASEWKKVTRARRPQLETSLK